MQEANNKRSVVRCQQPPSRMLFPQRFERAVVHLARILFDWEVLIAYLRRTEPRARSANPNNSLLSGAGGRNLRGRDPMIKDSVMPRRC